MNNANNKTLLLENYINNKGHHLNSKILAERLGVTSDEIDTFNTEILYFFEKFNDIKLIELEEGILLIVKGKDLIKKFVALGGFEGCKI